MCLTEIVLTDTRIYGDTATVTLKDNAATDMGARIYRQGLSFVFGSIPRYFSRIMVYVF